MILTGLALAFATVPEELPIIITMVLALGAFKLSQEKFLIKKIKTAEVLGNVTCILTDKTGTITENKMEIVSLFPKNKETEILKSALAAMTEISLSPTDRAILEKAKKLKLDKDFGKIIKERGFGNGKKTRAILREKNDILEIFVTGAPEEILNLTKEKNEEIEKELDKETEKGRRVIGIAKKKISMKEKNLPFVELEKDLEFVGLISFEDPPRKGVKKNNKDVKRSRNQNNYGYRRSPKDS